LPVHGLQLRDSLALHAHLRPSVTSGIFFCAVAGTTALRRDASRLALLCCSMSDGD
jgi:hypothetical protein